MILCDKTIKRMIEDNELIIKPITKKQIQPASVDIRLDNTFCQLMLSEGQTSINIKDKVNYQFIKKKTIVLEPQSFILGSTKEYVKLPSNISAFVEGRSSMGRLGLFIQNAGWVDPGFEGNITLELFNGSNYPIKLEAGIRIGQLVFVMMDDYAENPYNGKYQGQFGATGSLIHKDFTR